MASNRRPRKAYKPKSIHLPMMASSRDSLAMKLHLNVESLIAAPDSDAFNELCKKVASITDALSHLRGRAIVDDRDAAANAVRTCVSTLAAVHERAMVNSKLVITEFEAMSLRNAAGSLDVELARIPKNVMDAAITTVKNAVASGQWEPQEPLLEACG